MQVTTVAIARADDQTDPADLVLLAEEYPEAEFGTLITKRSGRPTSPSAFSRKRLKIHIADFVVLDGTQPACRPSPFSGC